MTPGWGVQVWATIFQVTDSHIFGKEVQKCKIRNVGNDLRPGSCRQHNIALVLFIATFDIQGGLVLHQQQQEGV